MTAPLPEMSLRLRRREWSRLAWIVVLSAALHLSFWGGYAVGKHYGIWSRLHLPAWAQALTKKLNKAVTLPIAKSVDQPPQLTFVDVSAVQETTEPPKNAAYYAAKNSQAANVDANKDIGIPKIEGKQTEVVKTVDADRVKPEQLIPSPQPPSPEETKPKPAATIGDLTMAKPEPTPREGDGQAEERRPRTIQEALSRQQLSNLPGQKMQQDGGVRRRARVASLDAAASPFGAYDQALIGAITQCWYDLLDQRNYTGVSPGRVVIRFVLKSDGSVSDVTVVDSTVDTILKYTCQKAIQDPAPFEPWPSDMRRMVSGNTRVLTFAFYYD